jgi:hypothetical protein
VRTMRQVKPNTIRPGLDELSDFFGGTGGRPERSDNLGFLETRS